MRSLRPALHFQATDLYFNDSSKPNLQGATNNALTGSNGTCTAARFVHPPAGQFWDEWPAEASDPRRGVLGAVLGGYYGSYCRV